MNIIEHARANIFFGDKFTCVEPHALRGTLMRWQDVPVVFQHQIHGVCGHAITQKNRACMNQFELHDGDYLITQVSQVGLGVLTADCLPIALFDQKKHAIAMIHAGWRGSVQKIVTRVVQHMQKLYNTKPEELCAWLGPCARACCYCVDDVFISKLPDWAREFVYAHDRACYFDLCACNCAELVRIGLAQKNIKTHACVCTICHDNFCSYRRDCRTSVRQMSIIWLK